MYFDELKRSMEWLSEQEDTIFLGQAVAVPGTAMSNTLKDISPENLLASLEALKTLVLTPPGNQLPA